jgi:hypothetical protein
VISAVEYERVLATGMRAGEAQREIVGLAPRVHKEADFEWSGKLGRQALGIVHDVGMEVARVRVQHRDLILGGADNAWMAMAHVADVVDHVQIRTRFDIVEKGAVAAYDVKRLAIGQAQRPG